jgi:peptidoglycan/LPS O-acetylase OafA/YrhL
MLGTLRLVLALMVALSHVDVGVAGLNVGVVAVVTFYLISGYVMTGLPRRHYASPRLVGRF